MQTTTETRTARLCDMLAAIEDPANLARRHSRGREFAVGFCATVRETRLAGVALTARQVERLGELYREALALQVMTTATIQGEGLAALRAMFDRAAATGAKRLACTVAVEGHHLQISRAPEGGRNPGALYVRDTGAYAGKILAGGDWHPEPDAAPDLGRLLAIFGEDPAAVAGAYGLSTGSCSFCTRPLTDPVSLAVGYGPICAKRYSLPHRMPLAAEAVEAPALV